MSTKFAEYTPVYKGIFPDEPEPDPVDTSKTRHAWWFSLYTKKVGLSLLTNLTGYETQREAWLALRWAYARQVQEEMKRIDEILSRAQ